MRYLYCIWFRSESTYRVVLEASLERRTLICNVLISVICDTYVNFLFRILYYYFCIHNKRNVLNFFRRLLIIGVNLSKSFFLTGYNRYIPFSPYLSKSPYPHYQIDFVSKPMLIAQVAICLYQTGSSVIR